ncbi:MAG: hypothetical protein Q9173_001952 [Seirophora scorigena]
MAQAAVGNPSSEKEPFSFPSAGSVTADDGLINASGYRQELERNFGLMSIIAFAITAGNTWVPLGGTIIVAAQTVSMYAAFHPEFVALQWHVFVSFLVVTWVSCAIAVFANRLMPLFESLGGFCTISGVFITIVVCAAMPAVNGSGYATNAFVWRNWVNSTGYSSDGFVFLLGMLNGAFSVGTPDVTTHMAEEIPR